MPCRIAARDLGSTGRRGSNGRVRWEQADGLRLVGLRGELHPPGCQTVGVKILTSVPVSTMITRVTRRVRSAHPRSRKSACVKVGRAYRKGRSRTHGHQVTNCAAQVRSLATLMTPVGVPENCFLHDLAKLPTRGGERRWRDDSGHRIYTWDAMHGEVEVFNSRGKHIGVADPVSGETIKPAVKGDQ
jgi:hypothetical protein